MHTFIRDRLARLRDSLPEWKMDTVMILAGENRRYLSGFTAEDTQFDESAGALFINDSSALLATDSRFVLQARAEAPLYDVICYSKGLANELPAIVETLGIQTLGFEAVRMSCALYHKIVTELQGRNLHVNLVEADDMLDPIRILKSEPEIGHIRKALHLAEEAFCRMARMLEPGMSEKQIAWELEKQMRQDGAEGLSFPTIVASGPNSALPHAIPGERRIQPGEPLLFDWGARVNGYCSDISRTLCMGGDDDMFLKVYQTVSDAQRMAIDAIRPGISAKAVDAVARNHIDQKGFGDRFGHSLGHGVGLAIHEHPRISPTSDRLLEPGMIFTVEPGIYLPDWGGIRLENMVRVTEDGAEELNGLDLDWRLPGEK